MLQTIRSTNLLSLALFIAGAGIAACGDAGTEVAESDVGHIEQGLEQNAAGHSSNDDSWRFGGRHGDIQRRNRCPLVDAFAFPTSIKVGESALVTGFAWDEDRRPKGLTTSWSASDATIGTFASRTAKLTVFTCKKEGVAHITFSAYDGDCTRKADLEIYCRPTSKPACGDGKVSGNETCDNSSSTKCPASCDDNNPCTKDTRTGDASTCNVVCGHAAVNTCKGGDSCCPTSCTSTNDSDCHAPVPCGDGKKSGDEKCDNSDPNPANRCPTSCNDNNPCTTDVLSGSAAQCNVTCSNTAITTCSTTADQCCAPGCNANTDVDCTPSCNGVLEPGETCDPNTTCPTSCDDGNACTQDVKHGSVDTCDVTCQHNDLSTSCVSGNGCCGAGCTHAQDSDCPDTTPKCGNGVLDSGETCDNSSSTKCPTSCDDGDACTLNQLQGSAAACSATCVTTPVTTCGATDGCCLPSCNVSTDADCAIRCGDGVTSSSETCDPNDAAHPCPTSCDDGNPCTDDSQSGSAATCDIVCAHVASTTPACLCGNGTLDSGELCDPKDAAHPCPTSCNDNDACTSDALTGSGCTAKCEYTKLTTPACLCGNGALDPNEACDNSTTNNKCPTTCDDANECTTDSQTGSAATCDLVCAHETVNSPSCNCGNGALDSGEKCDDSTSTKCPTSCDDGNACTADALTGSAAGCDAECTHTALTTPECLCGNGVLDQGEKCDNSTSTKCPTACEPSTTECVSNVLTGTPDLCNVDCVAQPITTCANDDACCPANCTQATDNNCVPTDRCFPCETTPNDTFGTLCPDTYAACVGLVGNTSPTNPVINPATGTADWQNVPKGALCKQILDCIHTSHCAANGASDTDCLCGPNNPGCFSGSFDAMTGACKTLIAAGAETNVPGDLATRFSVQDYATGSAIAVVELCDQLSCTAECLN